jgi:hypothetical protein
VSRATRPGRRNSWTLLGVPFRMMFGLRAELLGSLSLALLKPAVLNG